MKDELSKKKIRKLQSELQSKEKIINAHLEKIDYLEEIVMDLESALRSESDISQNALYKFEIKELERKNRDLKDRMGFLRLENVKLKQELEKQEKDQSISKSVIQYPKFEFNEADIEEDDTDSINDNSILTSSALFQKLTGFLKECVDDREILGSAIFGIDGKLLYASIPEDILHNVTREFEVRRKNNLPITERMFLELKNQQKICSEHVKVKDAEFNLVLIFSERVNFGIGNMLLKDIDKKIVTL